MTRRFFISKIKEDDDDEDLFFFKKKQQLNENKINEFKPLSHLLFF